MRTRSPNHLALLLFRAALVGCLAMLPATPLLASHLRRTPIVRAIEEARPSIVNIQGRKTVRPEGGAASSDLARQVNGMGTGVVIDQRGYIVTNYHVVQGVARIQVTLDDGRALVGRLVAHDSETDLAIVKIDVSEKLPVVRVGRSYDLMTGEPVIAVGNAFGYEHTVTRGIISALHRTVQVSDQQKYSNLIQTDASINPGNSGGPLLNIDGDMIGINVAVRVGAQGIGFAIPIDEAMEVMASLVSIEQNQELQHGVLGETQTDDEHLQFRVVGVAKGSPAEVCGLKAGDAITSANGQPVKKWLDFERALLDSKAGDKASLEIARQGNQEVLTLEIAAAQRETTSLPALTWETLGLQLTILPRHEFRRLNTRYRGGLRVVAVRPNSPAAQQGIRRGDVLVGMHEWETLSLENVAYILNRADFQSLQPVKFYILRGNDTLFGYLRVADRN